uniref:Uncharacterized protein n=1 Tax=Periophthalmus magnuspinnatus TaxID=409849 RepID=A0A3B4A5N3_9GOBI
MKKLWLNAGIVGSLSAAFGSILWSQKTNESNSSRTCSPLDSEPTSPYELQLVQVLFRHGARTPLKSIPNVLEAQWVPTLLEPPPHTHINFVVTDLNGGPRPSAPMEENYRKNLLTGGSFAGQLTTLGMQQLYELGKRLRQRYIEDSPFLSPAFSPSEVYVRSTNIWRTIESAKCLVAGLFQQKQKGISINIYMDSANFCDSLSPSIYVVRLTVCVVCSHRWAESSTLPDIAADLRRIQEALGIAAQQVDFILIRDDMVAREVTVPHHDSYYYPQKYTGYF